MKIKDIVSIFKTTQERVAMACRIYNATPDVRAAIREYREFEELPIVKVRVRSKDGTFADISSKELNTLYGLNAIASLLMISDIKKAQANGNAERLDTLLATLVNGQHTTTPETRKAIETAKESIRHKSPGVWAEYQRICQAEAAKAKSIEADYRNIAETEL